ADRVSSLYKGSGRRRHLRRRNRTHRRLVRTLLVDRLPPGRPRAPGFGITKTRCGAGQLDGGERDAWRTDSQVGRWMQLTKAGGGSTLAVKLALGGSEDYLDQTPHYRVRPPYRFLGGGLAAPA